MFACYDIAQTLKQKTKAKRAQGNEMELAIHDEMDIAKITPKVLLSASKTSAPPTFLVMSYWRNTNDRRKGGGLEKYHSSKQSTPLLG